MIWALATDWRLQALQHPSSSGGRNKIQFGDERKRTPLSHVRKGIVVFFFRQENEACFPPSLPSWSVSVAFSSLQRTHNLYPCIFFFYSLQNLNILNECACGESMCVLGGFWPYGKLLVIYVKLILFVWIKLCPVSIVVFYINILLHRLFLGFILWVYVPHQGSKCKLISSPF